jgi:hypothetical protein
MRGIFIALLGLLFWAGFYLCIEKFYSSIKRAAHKEQPREEGATLEFFVTSRMRFLIRLVLVLLIGFTILVAAALTNPGGSLLALLIPISVLFLILLAKPVAVMTNEQGIQQGRWLLSDKEIKWAEIGSIAYGTNTGTTYVLSKGGDRKIRFSAFLVGRSRFVREIRAHVGNIETMGFPEDD